MKQKLFAFLHNAIAHPLLTLPLITRFANWFHDWTGEIAFGELPESWQGKAVFLDSWLIHYDNRYNLTHKSSRQAPENGYIIENDFGEYVLLKNDISFIICLHKCYLSLEKY